MRRARFVHNFKAQITISGGAIEATDRAERRVEKPCKYLRTSASSDAAMESDNWLRKDAEEVCFMDLWIF